MRRQAVKQEKKTKRVGRGGIVVDVAIVSCVCSALVCCLTISHKYLYDVFVDFPARAAVKCEMRWRKSEMRF